MTEVITPVTAGEQVTVTAEVENTGEMSGTQTVTAGVDGLGSDRATVSLDEQGSRSLTLAVGTGQADGGEYTLTVEPPEPLFRAGLRHERTGHGGRDADRDRRYPQRGQRRSSSSTPDRLGVTPPACRCSSGSRPHRLPRRDWQGHRGRVRGRRYCRVRRGHARAPSRERRRWRTAVMSASVGHCPCRPTGW